jgi:hypothetical protein
MIVLFIVFKIRPNIIERCKVRKRLSHVRQHILVTDIFLLVSFIAQMELGLLGWKLTRLNNHNNQ